MASHAVVKAVQSAHYTQTRLLVKMGADVNGRDMEGKTPLIHALSVQDPKARTRFLRLLLEAEAVVSMADNQHSNALMWACQLTGRDDVRLLLRHGDEDLDLNAQNCQGRTALWTAVDSGKVGVVEEVLQAMSRYDLSSEVPDHVGVTPAMRAATLGYLHCLQALIAHLDTAAKSNNTLLNVFKINQILKSMYIVDKPKTTFLSPRPTNPKSKAVKLPTIQIISNPGHPQLEQSDNCALFSLQLHRERTMTFTPVSFRKAMPGRQPHSVQKPSVSAASGPDFNQSSRDTGTDRTVSPDEKSAPEEKIQSPANFKVPEVMLNQQKVHVASRLSPLKKKHSAGKFGNRRGVLSGHKHSMSTAPFTDGGLLSMPKPGRIVLKPVARVTLLEDSESIRDSLPEIFRVFTQETTRSFRRTAVKPLPKKPKKSAASPCPAGSCQSKWTKVKGLTLITGDLGSAKDGSRGNKGRRSSRQRRMTNTSTG